MMESSSNNKKKVGGFLVYQRRRKGTKSGKISNPQENISSPSESCLAKTDGELKDAIGEGAIAKKLAELSVKEEDTAIVGGEDSVAAVEKAGLADKISHISSGADASSELTEEKSVPGVLALNDAKQK